MNDDVAQCDRYSFLKIFSKYGKVSKLDFLFHKAGPNKGKPRGFAFVEYAEVEDATKALVNANDKLLRGRKLVITYANQAPNFDNNVGALGSGGRNHNRRTAEVQRPTTLSLIKSVSQPGRTEDKIAALEAKLLQMERTSESSSAVTLQHPSLPLKPPSTVEETRIAESSAVPKLSGISLASSDSRAPPIASFGAGERKWKNTPRKGGRSSDTAATTMSGPGGIGKKPTLQQLMKRNKSADGLLKR